MENKEAIRGREYDHHTDSSYTVPECPHCHTPIIVEPEDIGKDVPCPYCEKTVRVPDVDWIRRYIDENNGTRTSEQKCVFCGKMFTNS